MFIDTVAIGTLVMLFTQIAKKLLPGEGWGPYVVVIVSAFATAAWLASQPALPGRTDIFVIAQAYAQVTTAAIGTYTIATMDTTGTIAQVDKAARHGLASRRQAIPSDDAPPAFLDRAGRG